MKNEMWNICVTATKRHRNSKYTFSSVYVYTVFFFFTVPFVNNTAY